VTSNLDRVVALHATKGIVLDTNLLLLLLIGHFERELVGKHKRTNTYTLDDYDLLVQILSPFDTIITTPNILTEVSNLAAQLRDPKKTSLFEAIRGFISNSTKEQYIPSHVAAAAETFTQLGLTDTVIEHISADGLAVLTDDLDLYLKLIYRSIDALNFNHFKEI
jgi:hypothetical protein